ncbi:hypothetical protein [Streptomyces canus]|uniref:hypothetical protein n=1 Tax=Streptomyces canus TaxID=58343 RepID=UPI0036E14EF5
MAGKAGVLGVVCVRTGVSDALAKDQYSPFTTGYQNCTALWVGPTADKELRAKALLNASPGEPFSSLPAHHFDSWLARADRYPLRRDALTSGGVSRGGSAPRACAGPGAPAGAGCGDTWSAVSAS